MMMKHWLIGLIVWGIVGPAWGYDNSHTVVRVGYANVDFREQSDPVLVNGAIQIGRLSVESQRSPLLTFARRFAPHWGIEVLIPFAPLELEAVGRGGVIDNLPVGSADVWPIAVTVQYYPFETQWAKPYLGVGANYSIINHEEVNAATAGLLGIDRVNSVDADNSLGIVAQLGVDFPLTDRLSLNVSTSYLDLSLDAKGVFTVGETTSTIEAGLGVQARPNLTVVGFSYQL